jgi:ribulose-5-phosphate 4-epimerase/fuculose-1-phosphate aldolase
MDGTVMQGTTQAEWKVRCDLAAFYRLVAKFRMTDLIYTHISARVPGRDDQFFINQFGVAFERMRASDLVKIDAEGRIVDDADQGKLVNAAGFTIHSAVHAARHDLFCVAHTHTAAGIAVSCQEEGLLPISQHALKFYGHLGYHDYQGIALELEERESLVRDLGPHRALILRNHGLLAAGRTIPEAFDQLYFLERACQAQIAAQAGGGRLVFPPEAVRRHTAAQFNDRPDVSHLVDLAWHAELEGLPGGREAHCC